MKKSIIINLLGIFFICFVLLGTYIIQFFYKEFSYSTCLIERIIIINVAFGLVLNLQYGINSIHYSISILSSLLGIFISVKHLLLNINNINNEYNKFIFGFHIYIWVFLIFFGLILFITLLLFDDKEFKNYNRVTFYINPFLKKLYKISTWILILLTLANFFTTIYNL